MSIASNIDHFLPAGSPRTNRRIALTELDNSVLLEGMALWRKMKGERRYPARNDISVRTLKPLLRNICLLKVIDCGQDYDYRIVGDAYVLAHGISLQGKLWSEARTIAPGYTAYIKPIYDEIVREAQPIATRGWIERLAGSKGHVYSEYLFLPLGEGGVDHILIFAAYIRRDGLEHVARPGSFDS